MREWQRECGELGDKRDRRADGGTEGQSDSRWEGGTDGRTKGGFMGRNERRDRGTNRDGILRRGIGRGIVIHLLHFV